MVAGFSAWQSKFERHVNKGEKAIKIFAPVPVVKREEKEKIDPETRRPIIGEDGMPVVETIEQRYIAKYNVVYVFDVLQTNGKPIPVLAQNLTGNVEQYEAFMDAIRAVSPLPIVFEPLAEGQDGYCRMGEKIAIREGMSEVQTVCAALHELTHARLHDLEALRLAGENAQPKDRRTEEIEAESVSFCVSSYFSVETGANSFGYIAEYAKSKELKELNASLDLIRKTSAELIDAIEGKFREIAKERGIDLTAGIPAKEQDVPAPETTDLSANQIYYKYSNIVAERAAQYAVSSGTLLYTDEDAARRSCDQIVNRVVNDLLLEAGEHYPLYTQYMDNPDFKERLEDYAFIKAYLEPMNAKREAPSVSEAPQETSAPAIIAAYARNAEVSEPRQVGANVLMTPVFDDMNFNRDENDSKMFYFLTASGRIDRLDGYFNSVWNEQTRKWESYRPTEADIDGVIPKIAERFENDMADPAKWAMYQHAAVLNRLDECEAHNIPVRQLRDEETKERKAKAEQARQEEQRQNQENYDSRVDEIAKAIENKQEIKVGYSQHEYGGKNPILDLFKLYDIALPLRTQGWVNTGLAAITESGYRYFTNNNKRASTVFGEYLVKLREAIKAMPIEKKRENVGATLPNHAAKEGNNTVDNKLYDKFEKLFPQIANGGYRYMRLEAGDGGKPSAFEPLSVEWIGKNSLSVMHTYKMNGDLMYDPMIEFSVDRENRRMTAAAFEQSMPPLHQRVEENGDGLSVDGNGRQSTVRGLEKQLNDFTSQWFDNIAEQGYMPIRAVMEINGEDVDISFGADGKPIMPEQEKPAKQYDLNYGHLGNGLTVWNRAEERDGDYVTVAHIDPDRFVKFYDKDMPDNLKARIEHIARTSDARVSVTQQEQRVFHTPPQPYELEYHDIPVYGSEFSLRENAPSERRTLHPVPVEVYNGLKEQVANVLDNGRVEYTPGCYIPKSARDEIEAFAQNRANGREAEFLNMDGDACGIYLFEPKLDDNRAAKDNYRLAWFGALENGDTLDTIRGRFGDTATLPYDCVPRESGKPLGVLDIIVLKQNGEVTPWQVDMLAYSKRQDFFGNMELTAAKPEVDKPKITELDMSMPDPLTSTADRDAYGYIYDGMLPLSNLRAVELFDTHHCVYLLYPDDTEGMAVDRDEILKHDGLCGIEREDWERSPVRAAQLAIAANSESRREADLLYSDNPYYPENKFGIYQIRDGIDEARNFRFAPMRELEAIGLSANRANYELVYTAPFPERIEFLTDRYPVLNRIYQEFNDNQPADYTGHSVSVSDVIVLKYNGGLSSHYVDSTGFVEIDNSSFFGEETRKAPIAESPAQTGESEKTDSLSQVGTSSEEYSGKTVAELEADVNAGKVISLTDLSKAVNAERNNAKHQNDAPKAKKPTLMERLQDGKRRAAAQGQQDMSNSKKREGIE